MRCQRIGDIDLGVLEHVADVQRAGDVRRRNYERKTVRPEFSRGAEDSVFDPPLGPMRLKSLRLIDFYRSGYAWEGREVLMVT